MMFELEDQSNATAGLNITYTQNKSDELKRHIDGFSCKGLRTLAYGYRVVSNSEYEAWSKEYDALKFNMQI